MGRSADSRRYYGNRNRDIRSASRLNCKRLAILTRQADVLPGVRTSQPVVSAHRGMIATHRYARPLGPKPTPTSLAVSRQLWTVLAVTGRPGRSWRARSCLFPAASRTARHAMIAASTAAGDSRSSGLRPCSRRPRSTVPRVPIHDFRCRLLPRDDGRTRGQMTDK